MQSEDRTLDSGSAPGSLKKRCWYPVSATGYLAEPRVGHTATYIASQKKVLFIGGANPTSLHQDTWSLDLDTLTCSRLKIKGDFEHRYEHCACVPKTRGGAAGEGGCGPRVWVFGGADMEGNKNDLWELDVERLRWNGLTQQGHVPTKRTIHTATSGVDNEMVVFGGGATGSTAEPDTRVYKLNAAGKMWSVVKTTGKDPEPRHGHVLVAVKDKLYVHGGLSGERFLDDLHVLSPDGSWRAVTMSVDKPSGRASHGSVSHGADIYLFGGLSTEGALNDMWRLNTEALVWQQITLDWAPSPRLDFAIAMIELPATFGEGGSKVTADEGEEDDFNSIEEYLNQNQAVNTRRPKTVNTRDDASHKVWHPFILMHGGLDERGQVYDDFHVFALEP